MTKKERLDVIVTTCMNFFEVVNSWIEKEEADLDVRLVERIDQQVRHFCGAVTRAAEDLRTEAGVRPRPGGRPRLALAVEKIKAQYKEELRKRAGGRKVAVVELLASRFGVSKRTIYRALATPS
jgi:hypothetical protein